MLLEGRHEFKRMAVTANHPTSTRHATAIAPPAGRHAQPYTHPNPLALRTIHAAQRQHGAAGVHWGVRDAACKRGMGWHGVAQVGKVGRRGARPASAAVVSRPLNHPVTHA